MVNLIVVSLGPTLCPSQALSSNKWMGGVWNRSYLAVWTADLVETVQRSHANSPKHKWHEWTASDTAWGGLGQRLSKIIILSCTQTPRFELKVQLKLISFLGKWSTSRGWGAGECGSALMSSQGWTPPETKLKIVICCWIDNILHLD